MTMIGLPLYAMTTPSSTETTLPIPMRELVYSASDIAAAREAIKRDPWRRQLTDQITSAADVWLKRSDDWIRQILPPPGSLFSYGKNGCPACSVTWQTFGANTCSLDNPGKLVCPACKRVFPDPDPKSPYHDTGKGVDVNGQRYFLVGIWNAFVVDQLYSSVSPDACAFDVLSHAYALTGRDEYARKALTILDALATLSPTTLGPRDFDEKGRLDSDQGRLHILTAQVYRCISRNARLFDIMANNPILQEESPTSHGVTMMQNIRKGIFEDYLFKCFDVSHGNLETLHNIEADSTRATLVVGLLFGIPEYIEWGMDEFDSFISNTLDRDGTYYEISLGYAAFAKWVFCDMAEMCANYRPEKYKDLPGKFPPARNFFDNPKLIKFCVDNYDIKLAGHTIPFGDGSSDRSVFTSAASAFGAADWGNAARFALYSSKPEVRERARRIMNDSLSGRSTKSVESKWWALKMSEPLPTPEVGIRDLTSIGSGRFFSTKGFAAFQMGEWPNRRGFALRAGPNLPHAQDDMLELHIVDLGRTLSAVLGYNTYDTHVHKGFSRTGLSHNLVVVDMDEKMRWPGYFKKGPGGNWRSYYDGDTVKYADVDASSQFTTDAKVSKYRRRVAAVEADPAQSYYIDVFDVDGGSTRDYSMHMPYNDDLLTGALTFEGVDVQPVRNAWTLAGLNPKWQNARFNAPGMSFGERLTQGEFIRKAAEDDDIGKYGWTPPANGYAFLYNLRGAHTDKPFSATWELEREKGDTTAGKPMVRATFLPTREMDVYAANAPDVSAKHLQNYLVCRDQGTSSSRFVAVIEPHRGKRSVRAVETVKTDNKDAVLLKLTLANGGIDYVLLGNSDARDISFRNGSTPVSIRGEFAVVRTGADGKLHDAHLFRGERLSYGDVFLASPGALKARVKSVDFAKNDVHLEQAGKLPAGSSAPRFAVFSSPQYTHNTAMAIAPDGYSIGADGSGMLSGIYAPVQKVRTADRSADGATTSSVPLPLTNIHDVGTRFVDGKKLVDDNGRIVGAIREMINMKAFYPAEGSKLDKGATLEVTDIAPGDEVELPLAARWTPTKK